MLGAWRLKNFIVEPAHLTWKEIEALNGEKTCIKSQRKLIIVFRCLSLVSERTNRASHILFCSRLLACSLSLHYSFPTAFKAQQGPATQVRATSLRDIQFGALVSTHRLRPLIPDSNVFSFPTSRIGYSALLDTCAWISRRCFSLTKVRMELIHFPSVSSSLQWG